MDDFKIDGHDLRPMHQKILGTPVTMRQTDPASRRFGDELGGAGLEVGPARRSPRGFRRPIRDLSSRRRRRERRSWRRRSSHGPRTGPRAAIQQAGTRPILPAPPIRGRSASDRRSILAPRATFPKPFRMKRSSSDSTSSTRVRYTSAQLHDADARQLYPPVLQVARRVSRRQFQDGHSRSSDYPGFGGATGVTTLRRRLSSSRMNGVRFDSGPQR